ncbi:wax ester/triacylglycerol synthase family O-acyltransferase [Pseudohalioglobus sediminis]|uniref:diacylglycerol O-acyltransferase n=1 Tax=Pseudohalioglobus sediminis TaxID=2606449 RepID=A0A5B0WZQ1_9GAMM|nr:wax ester/triacylglycerol synthase family O-acyltransferase [Pseudohalioglobus sediminis]KAA1192564.1 wax ester/triacylglycerol synthase family O-acyltransferase [Pseudohalioglobus sediminis]
MRQLGVLDKGFLIAEKRETPMHVGGVSLYTLPDGADEQAFLHDLAANLRNADTLLPPFGDRLKTGLLGLTGATYWEPDPSLDLDYHVRHSALPKPGRYRELFTLVSRLHGTLLDRQRPLWEIHLIEGLGNRQFAVYTKTHHAAVDGARSVHVSRCMLSTDPGFVREESPLSLQAWNAYKAGLKSAPATPQPRYSDTNLRRVSDAIKFSFDSGGSIVHTVSGLARALTGRDEHLYLPHLSVPRTSINTSVDGARRFVAQSWPFARIKAVAVAYDGTFNDAILAMCSGALRKYLQLHAELPETSLKAMVPVSLRREGDVEAGNAVTAISADLATHIPDPGRRFSAIKASMRAGKEYFGAMSPREAELFTLLMQTPSLLMQPLGLISRLPPYNTVISNVPGMSETMYWNGARMDGSYPMSIVTDGISLNITLVTYAENVDFGIIACRRSVPQVQRMIDYMEDALVELEDAAGLSTPAATRTGSKRRKVAPAKPKKSGAAGTNAGTKPKPRTKSKAKTKARPKAKPATTGRKR